MERIFRITNTAEDATIAAVTSTMMRPLREEGLGGDGGSGGATGQA